jgi:phosphonate transport system ATP-binding protein
MAIIEFDKVDLVYPNGFHALKEITCKIEPGEFVAVIGRSGAGKSTFLRALNRTIEVTGGRADAMGYDLRAIKGRQLVKLRSQIGFIFQQFNLVKNLSAKANVLHGRLAHVPLWRSLLGLYPEADLKLAEEALNAVGLDQKHDARVDALSGGQQQRVAIARAIVQNPKLILADEPMASLDPKLSEIVLELLRDFNRTRGMTTLVNLHVLELATKYSDRIIGFREGRIVFNGKPDELTKAALDEIYEGARS